MSLACQPWLPAGTAAPVAAQRAVQDMVAAWSREWFADDPVRAAGPLAPAAAPRSELRKTSWHGCEEMAIGMPPAGLAALGAMVLGVSPASGQRTPNDLELLDALGKECLDGLKARSAQLFGLGKPVWHVSEGNRDRRAVHRLEIVTANRALALQLELSEACFVRLVRGVLPAPAERPALAPGDAALAALPASLSAMLGHCRISVAELAGLAPGDVLVLDRAIAEPAPLALAGVALPHGRCAVIESAAGPALEIVQAPSA